MTSHMQFSLFYFAKITHNVLLYRTLWPQILFGM